MNNIVFCINLEELLNIFASSKKCKIVNFLRNNFTENVHYIIRNQNIKKHIRGGHNKIDYFMTETAYELIKNTFNLRYRYLTKINDNFSQVNLLMSIENKTIGFIESCFRGVLDTKRQQIFGKYKVDLYFIKHKIVVECDENDHIDRNKEYETEREYFILSYVNTIIRFNPNHKQFDLSFVLKELNKIVILGSIEHFHKIVKLDFI